MKESKNKTGDFSAVISIYDLLTYYKLIVNMKMGRRRLGLSLRVPWVAFAMGAATGSSPESSTALLELMMTFLNELNPSKVNYMKL